MNALALLCLLAADPQFIPAEAVDDAPDYVKAHFNEANGIRSAAFQYALKYEREHAAERAKRKALLAKLPKVQRAQLEAEDAKSDAESFDYREQMRADVSYSPRLPDKLRLNAIGVLSEQENYSAQVVSIVDAGSVVARLPYLNDQNRISWNTALLKTSTTGLADGSDIDAKGAYWVSGTQRIGGSTLFVLEPIDLAKYLKK